MNLLALLVTIIAANVISSCILISIQYIIVRYKNSKLTSLYEEFLDKMYQIEEDAKPKSKRTKTELH
jgi:hypothetical protein